MTMTRKINKLEKPGGPQGNFHALFGRSPTFYGHFQADVVTSEWSTRISPSPPCRLINPPKNEVGKISKIVLEKINKKLLKELDFNQWKNTDDAIQWFRNIQNKSECKFIQLDIKEFYPSITEKS